MNETLFLTLFLVVPWILVVGALVIDRRTGKGYALGLLALLLLLALIAVTILVANIATDPTVLHPTGNAGGLEAVFLWFLLLACTYLALVVEIGVVAQARHAGRRWWLWVLRLAMLCQVILAVSPFAALLWVGTFGLLALLLLSMATVLAYSVRRTFLPAARVRTEATGAR